MTKDRWPVGCSFGEREQSTGREGVAAGTLAEALAILMVDLIGVMPLADRASVREQLANRLDEQSRTPGGSETAVLLGAVGTALMRLEA